MIYFLQESIPIEGTQIRCWEISRLPAGGGEVINRIPYGLRLPPIPYGGHMAPYLKSQKMVGWG